MKILVIEDDLTLNELLASFLRSLDHQVICAGGGARGLELARTEKPALILLDVMMPDMDGWEVLERLRHFTSTPVLFLTAKGAQEDVVRGLALGADDYMRKPFDLKELELRIAAILRRSGFAGGYPEVDYDDGWLRVDLAGHSVSVNGQPVRLTPTEYRLLAFLIEHRGRTVGHKELLTAVWGPEYADDSGSLQVYIRYLRSKLEQDSRRPAYIMTEWGIGYRFVENVTGSANKDEIRKKDEL